VIVCGLFEWKKICACFGSFIYIYMHCLCKSNYQEMRTCLYEVSGYRKCQHDNQWYFKKNTQLSTCILFCSVLCYMWKGRLNSNGHQSTSNGRFWLSFLDPVVFALKIIKLCMWLSNLSTLSILDEGDPRNASWALNLISSFITITRWP
jgi:hypothetical protein